MFEDAGTDTVPGDPDAAVDAPSDALMCSSTEMKCGDACVNTNTDDNNCGACGTVCSGGATCQSGVCCAAGTMNCGGVCVDVSSDEANCGSCTNACTGVGATCQNGTCCDANSTVCGNQCFDLESDEAHCGNCQTACGNGQECLQGVCCAIGEINCNDQCFDPNTEEAHCGDCQTSCGAGTQTCDDGICCNNGLENCSDVCRDLENDINNCGTCGVMCGGTESCVGGLCCTTGQNNCPAGGGGETCSDPMTDEMNCGGCAGGGGVACASGDTCSSGICCAPGKQNCGGVCVDITTDNLNCGACGDMCTVGAPLCSGGDCTSICGPGETNCTNDCVATDSDHNNCGGCGIMCSSTEVCNNGTCSSMCASGEVICDGACVNTQTDPNYCGGCNTVCAAGDECVLGACQLDCPSGEQLCTPVGGGAATCENLLTDPDNCGVCGTDCGDGTCQNGLCCGPGLTRCGNTCVDLTDNQGNCGSCGNICSGGDVCDMGACCASTENNCGGTCSDPQTDNANCGACGLDCTGGDTCDEGICCGVGEENVGGICCTIGFLNCNDTCTDPLSDAQNCGVCGNDCGVGNFCNGGTCQQNCDPPNELTCVVCTNVDFDADFCGTGCVDCPTGSACFDSKCGDALDNDTAGADGLINDGCPAKGASETACADALDNDADGFVNDGCPTSGAAEFDGSAECQACPSGPPSGCGGTCTDTDTDTSNCGACGINCAPGEACTDGFCCPIGFVRCGGVCVDVTSDEANCGACGTTCGTGSVCNAGSCACAFGQIDCDPGVGNSCVTATVDPLNCGSCGNVCGAGPNAGEPFCVSNGCTDTCPAPLTGCDAGGPNAKCSNLDSDNDNCGACGNACPGNQGCSDGECVPKFVLGDDPAKCVGGGPPISVPTGGGQQTCTGNLGATSFTFGLCSRTNIGPLSQDLFTDAFNSLEGPYKASCTTDSDCGTTGKCVGDPANGYARTCAGGGVGVNGTIGPVASNTATTHVGGDFWVFGEIGLVVKNDTTVKQRMFNKGPIEYTKQNRIFGTAFIDGPWATQGQADLRIDGLLTTAAVCDPLPMQDLQLQAGCTTAAWNDTLAEPCGTSADLIPVRAIVEHFRNPANNDNAAIGLPYNALVSPSSSTRIELPCGYYYLDSIGGSNELTLVVKGRTALFIGGAANINVNMIFDVEPTASLDMFVGGVVRIAQPITLGNPAYPRLTRMYIGSSSTLGGGGTCTSNSDCGSGLCSTCPASPFAPCTGVPGTCAAGPALNHSIDMSQGGFFNGLLWAGYGSFSTSNAVEMYGSVFTNYADASGALKIHYDNAAVLTGEECPPPANQSCESCRDCNNQACKNNTCGACTADSDCCPPLRCDTSSGTGTCVL